VKDRPERDFVIQPTSEECITDIALSGAAQLQAAAEEFLSHPAKFRGRAAAALRHHARPRVHDEGPYSFDRDKEGALKSYQLMYDRVLAPIFDRFGLQYRAVAADTGAIGGDASHEFQVIADTGEDALVYCPTSDFAANIELAEAVALIDKRGAATQSLTKTPTPGKSTCEDVARCSAAAATHGEVAGARHRRRRTRRRLAARRSGCCSCAATTRSTRSRPARCPA
jgi:prolyl-tRNA synthetase